MRTVKGWKYDSNIRGYKTSKLDSKFACSCGKTIEASDGLTRCKCGSTWASFIISPNGKEASTSVRIMRPVAEHRERVLATIHESSETPFFVRQCKDDKAPAVFDEELEKTAAGGWGEVKAPGFAASPTTTTKTPAVSVPEYTNPYANNASQNTNKFLDASDITNEKENQVSNTKNVTSAYNEEDYIHGWALAEANKPLSVTGSYTNSFLAGYRDRTVEAIREIEAEQSPGWDTVAPAFEEPTPGLNNGMSDFTNTERKDLSQETQDVRDDLAGKLDSDNAAGSSRSDETMGDLSGWKTSKLIEEINRRIG